MKKTCAFVCLSLVLMLFSCKKDESLETRLNKIEGRWLIADSYYEQNGKKVARTDFAGIEFTFRADKSFTGIEILISNDFYTNKTKIEKIPNKGFYNISDDGKTLTFNFKNGSAFPAKIETLNKNKLVLRHKYESRELVEVYDKK